MHTVNIQELDNESIQKAFLVPLHQDNMTTYELSNFINLGRGEANEISIADPFVSREHARIDRLPNGHFKISDLKSQNGTYVNGNRILEVFLRPGDRIRLGERQYLFCKDQPNQEILKSENHFFQKQLSTLSTFAKTDISVLLTGESGTGKELIAKSIHNNSKRKNGPFLSINCSALSGNIIESELFGHKKGSFTDAHSDRKGAFEEARFGTLVLDEIGDLPIDLQPKLLRALENQEIRPVGSDKIIKTDVRIIASTHKDLAKLVEEKLFRTDLFYRLNVIRFHIPPLRERMEDFESLLYSFAREMRVRFSHYAILELKNHSWPGNIRELRNTVSRASAYYGNSLVQAEDVEPLVDSWEERPNSNSNSRSGYSVLKEMEKQMILDRLQKNSYNQRKTAIDLGIPKSTLHDKLKSFGINVKELKTKTC